MSRCIHCDAALPVHGDCTACVSGRVYEVLPAFLGQSLHLDRRQALREDDAGSLAGIAPPPSIPPVTPVPAGLIPRADRAEGTAMARRVTPLSLRALAPPLPAQPSGAVSTPEALASHQAPRAAPREPATRAPVGADLAARAAALLGGPLGALRGSPLPALVPAQEAMAPILLDVVASPAAADPSGAPLDPLEAAAVPEPLRARPAAFWRRAVACTVDGALVVAVAALYLGLAHAVTGRVRLEGLLLPTLALLVLVAAVYATVGSLWGGRTLGLRVAGIRLVDGRGMAPAPMRALVRSLLGGVSAALFGIGFWLALVDRRGQTLHDKLTSTFIVQPI